MREESLIETLQDISDIKCTVESIVCAVESIAYADNDIDWEQRQYEIAKSAMNAILANREMVAAMIKCHNPKGFEYQVARSSVQFANALIAELKKTNETK